MLTKPVMGIPSKSEKVGALNAKLSGILGAIYVIMVNPIDDERSLMGQRAEKSWNNSKVRTPVDWT